MDLAQFSEFLGWGVLINVIFLTVTTISLSLFRGKIVEYHGKLFHIPEPQLNILYFKYLSQYKALVH